MKNACFFLGHSDAPSSLLPILSESIERHVTQYGVTEFLFGGHGAFDGLARRALAQARSAYPQIRRLLVTPYHPAAHHIEPPPDVDEILYPFESPVPPRYAISRANRAMIARCGFLIAYVHYPGRSRSFFEYAQRRAQSGLIHIENLECIAEGESP